MRYLFQKVSLRQWFGEKTRSREGLTLVEVLVALVIALILGAGVYQIFSGTQRTFAVNTALGHLQDEGRFAMSILRSEIRGSGYMGCQSDNFVTLLAVDIAENPVLNFRQAIYGLEAKDDGWIRSGGGGSGGIPVDPTAEGLQEFNLTDPVPLKGSDILVVRGVRSSMPERRLKDDDNYLTMQDILNLDSDYPVSLAPGGGDVLVASSCKDSVLFESNAYQSSSPSISVVDRPGTAATPGNSSNEFGAGFDKSGTVLVPQTQIFYVGEQEDGEPGLFRKIIGSGTHADGGFHYDTKSELVASGVERFLVRYYAEGTDQHGNAFRNLYVPASEILGWHAVRSLRIGLLVRSGEIADNLTPPDSGEYYVSGDEDVDFEAPGDRRLRMVFSGTVTLRNRSR